MKQKERRQMVTAIKELFSEQQIAHLELGYRPKIPRSGLPVVTGPEAMYYLALQAWDPEKLQLCEQFKVCLLNTAKRSLGICDLSTGGLRSCIAETAFILAAALLANASDIILLHNHPSGNCSPSQADHDKTANVKQAAALFNIHLTDHLIISPEGFYSITERNFCPRNEILNPTLSL